MFDYVPVTLQGSNLRERHRYLNSIVTKAFEENIPIKDIISLSEVSPIDRIFKIDLASKHKYVEYIMQNLKDDDMLYVSRCLKCHWLLDPEYGNIICPLYLENVLYPEMIQPAANKMKHWLQLNLKDAERCQEFYNYYKSNINDAIKFFWHCSKEFVLSEFANIVDKLTPVQLKILFEIYPSSCGLYFEILPNNRSALSRYVNDESNYFRCVKYLVKYDGNLFLDIVEKYFNTSKLNPFGPSLTEFIMKHYKIRVFAKIELYLSSILHIKTLAAHLTSDEAKQVVLQLARAEYLSYWFTYKKLEPLVKRVKMQDRTLLKKQVFVEKSIDLKVAEWPYQLPTPLNLDTEEDYVLSDPPRIASHHLRTFATGGSQFKTKKRIMKRKCTKMCNIVSMGKSPLDKLFNRYRFTGFERTFYELCKNLLTESTIEGRLNMMLVLVSKSGGVSKQVEKLLKFLVERHRNEPNTLRAAVIRSLIKRECVWRIEDQAWEYLLEFGHDIGLDGSNTELICREGLHAVIIKHLLRDDPISQNLLSGYLRNFSTLSEYKLNVDEKTLIAKRLPLQLLTSDPIAFLDVLDEYKVSLMEFPDATSALVKVAKDNTDLLYRLYVAKMLRRELFPEIFTLRQTDAMYLNALRYNIEPLDSGKSFALFASKQRPKHDKFLISLSIYFSEPGGLAEQHKINLEDVLKEDPKSWLARPLCMLLSNRLFLKRLRELNNPENSKNKAHINLSREFKANAHKTKPTLDIDVVEWQTIGAKAIANKAFICRTKDRERYLKKLLEWKRTTKISLRLSANTQYAVENFLQVCSLERSAALEVGFSLYLKNKTIDPLIWSALKSLIKNIKNISKKDKVSRKLTNFDSVPKNIEADYWVFVYNIFLKINKRREMPMLVICHLENLLPQVDRDDIRNILKEFIDVDLSVDRFMNDKYIRRVRSLYIRIIAKFLLLSKSENEQKDLLESVCHTFFDSIENLLKINENKSFVLELLNKFVFSLKYTKAFLGDYVTCMPVFETVLNRLHKILPIEENFELYANIHLTMLYFKSIKQTKKLRPDLFEDLKKNKETIEILGIIFGKYIGYEIKELVTRYFRSVIDLYKDVLEYYLRDHFTRNKGRSLLVTFIIKGILNAATTEAFLLAEHIFQNGQNYNIAEPHRTEILKTLLESNDEIKYFLYAHVLN